MWKISLLIRISEFVITDTVVGVIELETYYIKTRKKKIHSNIFSENLKLCVGDGISEFVITDTLCLVHVDEKVLIQMPKKRT